MLSRILRPSQFVSKALKTSIAPLKNSFKIQPIMLSNMRFFSGGVDQAKRRLDKVLSSEITHESENEEVDQSIDAFLSEKGWNLVESEDNNVMELKKNVEGNLITVFFQARNPPMDEPEENVPEAAQNQEGGEEGEGEEQRNWDDYVDFSVVVNNNSGK